MIFSDFPNVSGPLENWFRFEQRQHPFLWLPCFEDDFVFVPFWMPAALSCFALFILRYFRRPSKSNCCGRCGYSLAGLTPDSPCPECGQAQPATTLKT